MLSRQSYDHQDGEFNAWLIKDGTEATDKILEEQLTPGHSLIDLLKWPIEQIKSHRKITKITGAMTFVALLSGYGHVYVKYESHQVSADLRAAAKPTGRDAGEEAVKTVTNGLVNKQSRHVIASSLVTGLNELPTEEKAELLKGLLSPEVLEYLKHQLDQKDSDQPMIAQIPAVKP